MTQKATLAALVGLVIDERTLYGEVHLFLLIEGIGRTYGLLHALENVTIIAPFSSFFTLYHGYLEERFDHALGALSNKNYKNFSWQKD